MLKIKVFILFLTLALSACAAISEHETTARLSVSYAVLKVVAERPERAQRIVGLVAEAREYIEADTRVSVAVLEAALRERINWGSLDAADTLLIDAVITEAAAELSRRIGEGVLSEEQELQLLTVLGWIESAARMG